MMFNKYIYYTLGEVVSFDYPDAYPNSANDIDITSIMTLYGLSIEDSNAEKLLIFKQLIRYVYARFYDVYFFKKKMSLLGNEDENPTESEKRALYRQFIGMFNLTAPRYIPLLKSFNANESDPIAKISSTSRGKTRFNDTPQESGEYEDNDHTTHLTQSESTTETDTGSIVERLDALYRNWRSILKDWTNEYIGLFYMYETEMGGLL